MNGGDAIAGIGTAQVEDLETLHRHAADLTRNADAATQAYDRAAWIRYGAIWLPIPFVLLLFRSDLQVWHYYVAGALFLVVGLALYTMDLAAVAKRDKAIQAAAQAQKAYEVARMSEPDAG